MSKKKPLSQNLIKILAFLYEKSKNSGNKPKKKPNKN